MRNDSGKRNIVLHHQVSSQLRGTVHGGRFAASWMLTHLNPDAILIAWAIVVGMVSLLSGWQMLNGLTVIRRVMPRNPAQLAVFQRQGVAIGVRSLGPVLSAMNRDVTRRHVTTSAPTRAARDNILLEAHLRKQRTGAART